jgi:hypothetical protein
MNLVLNGYSLNFYLNYTKEEPMIKTHKVLARLEPEITSKKHLDVLDTKRACCPGWKHNRNLPKERS